MKTIRELSDEIQQRVLAEDAATREGFNEIFGENHNCVGRPDCETCAAIDGCWEDDADAAERLGELAQERFDRAVDAYRRRLSGNHYITMTQEQKEAQARALNRATDWAAGVLQKRAQLIEKSLQEVFAAPADNGAALAAAHPATKPQPEAFAAPDYAGIEQRCIAGSEKPEIVEIHHPRMGKTERAIAFAKMYGASPETIQRMIKRAENEQRLQLSQGYRISIDTETGRAVVARVEPAGEITVLEELDADEVFERRLGAFVAERNPERDFDAELKAAFEQGTAARKARDQQERDELTYALAILIVCGLVVWFFASLFPGV